MNSISETLRVFDASDELSAVEATLATAVVPSAATRDAAILASDTTQASGAILASGATPARAALPTLAERLAPQLAALSASFELATGWALRTSDQAPIDDPLTLWNARLELLQSHVLVEPGDLDRSRAALAKHDPMGAIALAMSLVDLLRSVADLGTTTTTSAEQPPAAHAPVQQPLVQQPLVGLPVTADTPVATSSAAQKAVARLPIVLETVLRSGSEAVGYSAAALYLLDEETTELTLQAHWNLRADAAELTRRPLCEAKADLEAMCGHAITLEDALSHEQWNLPARYPAAICVPVASSSAPLGTLWFFNTQRSLISDSDVNLAELVAGRVAAELDQATLALSRQCSADEGQALRQARRWQDEQLPSVLPPSDCWDMAGRTQQAQSVGGAFFDWFPAADDRLAIVAAATHDNALTGALSASALRALLRAHAGGCRSAQELLAKVNHSLCALSAGDQLADIWCGLLGEDGLLEYSAAGEIDALLMRQERWQPLSSLPLSLGMETQARFAQHTLELDPGELVIVSAGELVEDLPELGLLDRMIRQLAEGRGLTASLWADLIEEAASEHLSLRQDRATLVLRRR